LASILFFKSRTVSLTSLPEGEAGKGVRSVEGSGFSAFLFSRIFCWTLASLALPVTDFRELHPRKKQLKSCVTKSE
jgi:hypothetical protein